METIIRKIPTRIIQAIEEEELSTNYMIYHDNEHGWVYQQRDDAFTKLANEVHPLEKLGPFGRFDIFYNYEKTRRDLYV